MLGITTIVFDLDGTLLNTLDDLHASVNYALAQHGYPTRSKEDVRMALGNGVAYLIEKSLPAGHSNKAIVEQVLTTFRPYYLEHSMDNTRPYEGVAEMLAQVKAAGFKTAIVSNKPNAAVQELYDRFLGEYVDIAIGEKPDLQRKPAPDMVFNAIKRLNSSKEEAVYVGDSEVDNLTASNSGLSFVAVSWGFRGRQFLQKIGAANIIDQPSQLINAIRDFKSISTT